MNTTLQGNELIDDIVTRQCLNVLKQFAREQKLMVKQVATVATYDAGTNTATLYFPPDAITVSGSYKNKTGRVSLSVGEKVYLLCEIFNISQGWIID